MKQTVHLRARCLCFRMPQGRRKIEFCVEQPFPEFETLSRHHGKEITLAIELTPTPSVTICNEDNATPAAELGSALEAYRSAVGPEPTSQLAAIFTAIARWILEHGHGRAILSAVDRRPGTKVEFHTYYSLTAK